LWELQQILSSDKIFTAHCAPFGEISPVLVTELGIFFCVMLIQTCLS